MIVVMVVAVLAVLVSGLIYWRSQGGETTANTNSSANTNETNGNVNANTNTNLNTNTTTEANTNTEIKTSVQDDSERILRLSRTFVERYGTFSNRNNFENITTLEPYMSQKLRDESAQFIDANQGTGIDEEFYSIITSVISTSLDQFKEGKSAVVRVGTQRTETRGTEAAAIFTQHALLTFVNVDDTWKVDSLTWE